jgi:signal recognition particle GTPase
MQKKSLPLVIVETGSFGVLMNSWWNEISAIKKPDPHESFVWLDAMRGRMLWTLSRKFNDSLNFDAG